MQKFQKLQGVLENCLFIVFYLVPVGRSSPTPPRATSCFPCADKSTTETPSTSSFSLSPQLCLSFPPWCGNPNPNCHLSPSRAAAVDRPAAT